MDGLGDAALDARVAAADVEEGDRATYVSVRYPLLRNIVLTLPLQAW